MKVFLKTQTQTGLRQKYFSSLQNFRNIVYENWQFSSWDEHIWRQNLMALVTITINIGPDTIKEIFLVKWTRWTESGVSGKWGKDEVIIFQDFLQKRGEGVRKPKLLVKSYFNYNITYMIYNHSEHISFLLLQSKTPKTNLLKNIFWNLA